MAATPNMGKRLGKVRSSWRLASLFSDFRPTEEFWEELEDTLVAGDISVDLAVSTTDELKKRSRGCRSAQEVRDILAEMLVEKLESVPGMGKPIDTRDGYPTVVLLAGVNGGGKTTTAAKLAHLMHRSGKKVLFAAADTFRAAAIDQLKAWGEKLSLRVVAQNPGSDPAAVVFDAIRAATAGGYDLLVVDTAGRLHTKSNLMDEASKIGRVIDRECEGWGKEALLVLDAVSGQNGLLQARAFSEAFDITGVVLAKYDSTAKGGIVFSVAEQLGLPVRFVGLGEHVDDIYPFDPGTFVPALIDRDIEATGHDEPEEAGG